MFQLNVVPAIFNALALKLLSSPLLMVVASRTVWDCAVHRRLCLTRQEVQHRQHRQHHCLRLISRVFTGLAKLLHRWRRSRC